MIKKLTQKLKLDRLTRKLESIDLSRAKAKTRAILLGNSWKYGLIFKCILYFLLVLFGFIFLYPLIYMLTYSFMNAEDVVNPLVTYLPSSFYFTNFVAAFKTLHFWKTLMFSLFVSVVPSIFQCISAAIVGYGLAKFRFPGKTIVIILVVITFIIPPQLTMIPQLFLFTSIGMANILSFIITALFGQGIRSTIFILIFFQFFRSIPKSLDEAAKIDGANTILIFIKIACPLVLSGFILTFLFSFVWYFNETSLTALFFTSDKWKTLPLQLEDFGNSFRDMVGQIPEEEIDIGRDPNEAVYMAGTIITILPLLIIYFVFQRFFIEGIEKAGITGE